MEEELLDVEMSICMTSLVVVVSGRLDEGKRGGLEVMEINTCMASCVVVMEIYNGKYS